jgi:hypothetical protein
MVFGPANFVGLSHRLVHVGEQRVGQIVFLGEGSVLFEGVEGDPYDLGTCLEEIGGSITEPLALDRSPGGGGLHIPPEDHPSPCEIVERQRLPVVRRQRELRSVGSFFEQRGLLVVHKSSRRPASRQAHSGCRRAEAG